MPGSERLRVALLTYRGHPHVGGQGVYVHHLSRALQDLGHYVEVFAGPPYPKLVPGIKLNRIPSLDLYNPDDPFRRPRLKEFRDWIDAAEYGLVCSAAFPEPLTFSLRAARILLERRRDFDVVHDNQSLGYGLLRVARRLPLVATIHHPIPIDRQVALAHTSSRQERMRLRRWYSFTRMQGRVVRRVPRLISVSSAARTDVGREFEVSPERVSVVHNGVDPELFRPLANVPRVPGRIIAMTSADLPLKGLVYLVEAVAKARTEVDADLVLVGKGGSSKRVREVVARFGLEGAVRFAGSVSGLELVTLYSQAEVAVVPSIYEGFSLPAIEAMSCGLPVVTTTGGALPEVVGPDGKCGTLVPPADASAIAKALVRLLSDSALRDRMGEAGRRRVLERFTWSATAAATADVYRRAIAQC